MKSQPRNSLTRVYKAVRRFDRRMHHAHLLDKLRMQDMGQYLKLHTRDATGHRDDVDLDEINMYSRWNRWRLHYKGRPDLRDSNFGGDALVHANLWNADLQGVSFIHATVYDTILNGADLTGAELQGVTIKDCLLDKANMQGINLTGADISGTSLIGADLSGANLTGANLINCDFTNANLSDCKIYGISAWDLDLTGAKQSNLTITPPGEAMITVDNLEVAQFVYLLLKSEKLRTVLDTLTSKVVLILGRFTLERKEVLEAIREKLRSTGYLPVLFDFEKPASRDLTETITTLAHLSRFIIADLTDPKSVPHELASIIPTLAVPVQPIITEDSRPYAMFEDFQRKYRWVLATYYYRDLPTLLDELTDCVIAPAEQQFLELRSR